MIPMFAAAAFLFLFLAWNWLLYSFQFEEKVEQYDEHIALYVNNTFARTRIPGYGRKRLKNPDTACLRRSLPCFRKLILSFNTRG